MEQEQTRKNEYIKVAQFRAEADGKKLVLRGYPIVFNTETTIYDYWYGEIRETIEPTALDSTDLSNVYILFGHDTNQVLGRANVNLRLEKDETGLFMEVELPNTQLARDVFNLVESGIIDGMSFGFTTEDDVKNENGTLRRTIKKIDELYEVSIVTFPAYKEASVVAQRKNLIQQQEEERKKKELEESQKRDEEKKKLDEELKIKNEQEREKKLKLLEEI